jgi:tetratricopeptide (TPR) repeat protein
MNDSVALKSILLVAANPKGTVNLRLQEEEREIKERLRLAGYGKVPICSIGATRTKDIQQAMVDFKPQIVHFVGHGAGKDGLVFEDELGQLKLVSSEALANLFKLFSDCVECVILNACYSQFQADAISQHIDYVIGMSQAIGDRAAIAFSVGFYTALGGGESIEFAYDLGCSAIQLEGISEYLTPILKKTVSTNHRHLNRDVDKYYQKAKQFICDSYAESGKVNEWYSDLLSELKQSSMLKMEEAQSIDLEIISSCNSAYEQLSKNLDGFIEKVNKLDLSYGYLSHIERTRIENVKIFLDIEDPEIIASAFIWIGRESLNQDPKRAKTCFSEAIQISKNSSPIAYMGLGILAQKEKKIKDALKHFRKSRDLYCELGRSKESEELSKLISRVEESRNPILIIVRAVLRIFKAGMPT